jgi:multicomponent Na+:H+ antiporter subunit A
MWALRPHRFKHSGWFAAIAPALVTGWLLTQAVPVSQGNYPSETISWIPTLGLELSFRLDGLALLFALIVAGVGAVVAVYTGYYFEGDERQGYFYSLLFLFMASMLGLVLSNNMLCLFVFWELTSITSYLLIAFKDTSKQAREGGRRAFIVTGLGGLAMLAAIILLGLSTGTYTISEIIATPGLTESAIYTPALLLLLLGAFTKSAQFPFHFWLPGAMSAPTPASAYLHSATMVKAGVFLLARFHPALSDSSLWFWSLLLVGGFTMILGAVSAIQFSDLKALLAYATVGQLGMFVMLLALPGEEAMFAVVVGILAHSLYKGPLFLVAGMIDHATETRDLRKLAALWRPAPLLAATTILAALSMGGVIPFMGFLSKELALESFYGIVGALGVAWAWGGLAAVLLTGVFMAANAVILVWEPFLRNKPDEGSVPHLHHAPSLGFVSGPLFLALLGLLYVLALPTLEDLLFAPAVASIYGGETHKHLAIWHGWTAMFIASLGALAVGVIVFLLRDRLRALLRSAPEKRSGIAIFNWINDGVYAFAIWLTRVVQGGTMASQASVTLLAGVAVVVFAVAQLDWLPGFDLDLRSLPTLAEIILASLAIVAALVTIRADTRLSAIISLGVVGVTVTLYFIFFSAPDLALTQLLIEVLTVVLLVFVFFRIRADDLPAMPRWRRSLNVMVALAMGLFGFTIVLIMAGVQVGDSISPYFERFSVPVGKGGNIVNVILVDFRGYDTLGEITVLAIAAVGGFALLRAPRMKALRTQLLARLARRGTDVGGNQP